MSVSKTLYHSELVRLGEVEIEITGEITPSKFRGKPPFLAIKLEGNERFYVTENDECARALRDRRGQLVTLKATGSREEAEIEIISAAPNHRPQYNQHQPPPTPPPEQPETAEQKRYRETRAFVEATRYVAQERVLFEICYTQARLIFQRKDFEPSTDPAQFTDRDLEDLRLRTAHSLFIEASRRLNIFDLPAAWPDKMLDDLLEIRPEPNGGDDE